MRCEQQTKKTATNDGWSTRWRRTAFAGWAAFAGVAPAMASDTSGSMPWNSILSILEENITGPTATAVILIAIAAGAMYWSFSDDHRGIFRVAKAVIALGIVAGLATLVAALGIAGAVV